MRQITFPVSFPETSAQPTVVRNKGQEQDDRKFMNSGGDYDGLTGSCSAAGRISRSAFRWS